MLRYAVTDGSDRIDVVLDRAAATATIRTPAGTTVVGEQPDDRIGR